MGQQVKLSDVTFPTNIGLPILYPDGAMNAGSLYLVDFSNSLGYDNGAVAPVTGALLPNLAWQPAAAMIGSGNRTTLSSVASNTISGTAGLVEFTGKKGLHVITSQVNNSLNKAFIAALPDLINSYMFTNEAHNFFVSMWSRYTRLPLAATYDNHIYATYGYATPGANYAFALRVSANVPSAGGRGLGLRNTDAGALGTFYRNVGFNSHSGAKDAAYNTTAYKGWKVGPGFGFESFESNKTPSMVIYRFYIEDLTVSGRTYAQADADDFARYTAAFAAGGKFYGDTFTDPATLA